MLYLYGDPDILFPEIRTEGDENCLYVPIEDIYGNLTHKMLHAYRFLLEQRVAGVLKMDDNTFIRNYRIFKSNFTWYDYAGADLGELWPETHTLKGGISYTTTELMLYFGGPFYWLSLKGLEQVVRTGFHYPAEDVNTGYAINLDESMLIGNMEFYHSGCVSWDGDTE